MITQSEIKLLNALHLKKFRQKYNLFVAEGKKLTKEIYKSHFKIKKIYITSADLIDDFPGAELVEEKYLKKITFLKNHQSVFTLIQIPENQIINYNCNTLVLDDLQDPGNVGTLIRIADWFGIKQIICSENTVDVYNPKVIQATMGSIARVKIISSDIFTFLADFNGSIFAADINGESIYNQQIINNFALILGNEGNGISKEFAAEKFKKISIPRFSTNEIESLNVSVSGAIIISEFLSKNLRK